MKVLQLPVEITREIFLCLISQHSYSSNFYGHNDEKRCHYLSPKHCLYPAQTQYRCFRYGEDGTCICWQFDLLNVSMVCKVWNLICMNLTQQGSPWLHLLNLPSFKRTYPFRTRLVQLLKESYFTNLHTRQQVKRLTIDFASFDKSKDQNAIELLRMCPGITQLDIVYDSLFHGQYVLCRANVLRDALIKHGAAYRIKRLLLTSHSSLHSCLCCAGEAWDHSLFPILDCLTSLETLVLHCVLPTKQVLERLAQNPNLKQLVFHSALRPTVHGDVTTFVKNIPVQLWRQIKKIAIYENTDDDETRLWVGGQCLDQLASHVGSQLECLTLQFNSKTVEGDPCLQEEQQLFSVNYI